MDVEVGCGYVSAVMYGVVGRDVCYGFGWWGSRGDGVVG